MALAASDPVLLEREHELDLLRQLLSGARQGNGSLAFVEAPAGHGKTTLLRTLRAQAAADGFKVLAATGAELERDFPFGLVRQLLEGQLYSADLQRRAELLRGAASLAEPVFGTDSEAGAAGDVSHARLHGLYWLVANLSEETPLLLVADDVHWGDPPSVRFLAFLARRIEDLPVVLAVGTRPGEPGAEQDVLDELAVGPAAHVLRPAPLGEPSVAVLVDRAVGGEADPRFVAACADATAGNPLLLRELCRTLAADGRTGRAEEIEAVRASVPDSIARSVVARLRRLSPAALSLARSLAVLGDRARRAHVVALAEMPGEAADAAHEALVRAALIDPDEPRFIHPMVREAVYGDLIGGDRAIWHRRAAQLLADAGAGDDEIALHLLASEASGAPWAAGVLTRAGRRALADGDPAAAARLLRRAAEEAPPEPEVLLELGIALTRKGDPGALAALEAAAGAGDPVVAARAAQAKAQVLIMIGRAPEAPGVLRPHVEAVRPVDAALADELEDELLDALHYDDADAPEYLRLVRAPDPPQRPGYLAHVAWQMASSGAHRDDVMRVCERALVGGKLVALVGEERFTPFYLIAALALVEAAEEAAQVLRDAEAAARRSGSVAVTAMTWMTSEWERRFGDLRRAEDDARRGLEILESSGNRAAAVIGNVALAGALVDQGRIDDAAAVAALLPPSEGMAYRSVGLHATRGRILFEQGRFEHALAELDEHARAERLRDRVVDIREPRVLRARALAGAGRLDEARALMDEEVELAVRREAPGAESTARLARARLLDGAATLAELELAVTAARRSPMPQALARALLEQGAALRRANQRAAAREPLREAREVAHRCGAAGVAGAAHEELVVAGGRPQRIALAGVESLTAAEKRVADLAAQGLRNREIAEALFVTLKTVEVHLGHVYAKLGIQGRSQLKDALG
jgi:DNA-binding CsgD family transcriptional regulator